MTLELLAKLPLAALTVGLVLGLAGIWLALTGLAHLRHLKLLRFTARMLAGGILLLGALVTVGIATNLQTYQRLTYEQTIGEVSLRGLGATRFEARLDLEDRPLPQTVELLGDEWQIDARLLKWRGIANLLGLDTLYRLERISGRYRDIDAERLEPRSVHSLADNPGIDLWSLTQRHQRWLRLADAVYGSAVYVPMADGARYTILVSQSGLLVRPANEIAKNAIQGWE
jgi:hypothetical protein